MQSNIDFINYAKNTIEANGGMLVLVPIPEKAMIYSSYQAWRRQDAIHLGLYDYLIDQLTKNNVMYIDIQQDLKNQSRNEKMYFVMKSN